MTDRYVAVGRTLCLVRLLIGVNLNINIFARRSDFQLYINICRSDLQLFINICQSDLQLGKRNGSSSCCLLMDCYRFFVFLPEFS